MISLLHARSSRRERFRILGVELLPLAVGHLRHLEAEGCDPVRTPADLGTALMICARPPERWASWSSSPLTKWRMALWAIVRGTWDFGEKLALWSDYIRWHTEAPVFTAKGEASESALPSYRLMRVRLMRLGYRATEIDSTPYLDALWDLMAAAELAGDGKAAQYTERELDEQTTTIDWDDVRRQATERLAAELKGTASCSR